MLKKRVACMSFSIIMAAALLALSPEVDAWPEFSDVNTEGCRTCHVSDDIHLLPAHSNQDCTNCHDVSDILFPVKPSNCMECHPLESQGDVCNLAIQPEHDCAGCLTCHDSEQENCKAIETTTSTTTAPVGHEANNGAVDESNCLVCHDLDGVVHSEPGHTNKDSNGAVCCACHDGLPGRGNVSASDCIVCHPLKNEGECNLVVFGGHQGEGGSFPCLACHEAHGDCEGTETTTSTTSVPAGHKENGTVDTTCLVCHEGLHDISAHSNCSACHDESSSGSVNASVCVECHPSGNPGTCNLTLTPEHACAGCLSCHSECPGEISTTTSVTEHAEDGAVDDTNCLLCHDASLGGALHSVSDHNNCCLCHGGTPGKGNVSAPACLACHPQENSAVCDLVVFDDHKDGPCFNCHDCPGVTTTTTTISSFEEHLVVCYGCHQLSDLHSYQGHSDCAKCHDDDSVGVGDCWECHPRSNPGKCPLITYHGTSCLQCHSDCSEKTTTTTTTIEVVTKDIMLKPASVLRSRLIPLPLVMVIEGTDCHFNDATSISFEGDATYPPLFSVTLPPTKILVFSIITRAGFIPDGTGEVTVRVRSRVEEGGGSYEEVGSSTLSLVVLPLIFAGEQEK